MLNISADAFLPTDPTVSINRNGSTALLSKVVLLFPENVRIILCYDPFRYFTITGIWIIWEGIQTVHMVSFPAFKQMDGKTFIRCDLLHPAPEDMLQSRIQYHIFTLTIITMTILLQVQ